MINPFKKNLPSTTARLVQPGSKRSGAKSTIKMTEETVPKIIKDMLELARYKDNEVNEKDLEDAVEGQECGRAATGLNQDFGTQGYRT